MSSGKSDESGSEAFERDIMDILAGEGLEGLPPSSKLVWKSLEYVESEGLRKQELVEETRMNPKTVSYGIDRLNEYGVLKESVDLSDARKTVYELREHFQDWD